MTERPILFSTPMMQALLAGRKTQTRRVIKGTPLKWLDEAGFLPSFVEMKENNMCPYGQPGDVLWVRETLEWNAYATKHNVGEIMYKADGKDVYADVPEDYVPPRNLTKTHWESGDNIPGGGFNWHSGIVPTILMPKWAARIYLRVKSVRVERAQSISEGDAIEEGIESDPIGDGVYKNYVFPEGQYKYVSAQDSFKSLWHSINGRESWEANPWVWVIEFEVLSTTGRP